MAIDNQKKVAAIDIDAQNTFTEKCIEELPVKGGTEIVSALNAQADIADLRIISKDSHAGSPVWETKNPEEIGQELSYENADKKWVMHALVGTYGWRLIDGLPPETDYDFIVYKGLEPTLHPYGACYHTADRKISTGLIEFLSFNNVETVLVGGLAMDFCVLQTLRELLDTGLFDVVLNLSATRALSAEGYVSTINELEERKRNGQRIRVINTLEEF